MRQDQPTDVIFIGGRSGVGKSSVAAAASRILALQDVRHAVIEGDNLDQAYPEPWRLGINLNEQNLDAMWTNYRANGYSRLIYTNTVSILQAPTLSGALGADVRATLILLTATDATAAGRLAQREIGSSLTEHIERSRLRATELEREADNTVHRVTTDGRRLADIATQIITLAGWT